MEWVDQGRQGDMAWFDQARARRACRADELLPGARSFISIGVVYSSPAREHRPGPLQGRVARYARGRDYHDVLAPRLWELAAYLRGCGGPDARTRVFVDTAPLAEREVAVRAGLGFYGKSTCLLAPGAGSYVLLGAILTNLPLEPDAPLQRDCGSCRLCLDACPTGALEQPYQLDSRLCISYLTIEHRGSIPVELRPKLGARVFGCDICQEVCPWNHGRRGPIPWPELSPSERVGADLDLAELMQLDDAAFRERFKGSPLKRPKRRGLLRNAAVALGNSRNPDAVPALAHAVQCDAEPLVRAHAAWALRHIGGAAAAAALESALESEQEQSVRAEIEGSG